MFQPADFKQTHQSRILIDRRMALGDVIMVTPVVREFRKRYPDAFIQVVTEKPEVLANNPAVDATVKPTEMKAGDPWDVYVNLNDAYETNVTSHYVDSMIYRAFGEDKGSIDRSLSVYETEEERQAVDEAIEQIGGDYIVLHMRRWAWENKNVDLEIWMAFITRLEEKYPDLRFVTVGADYDYKLPAVKPNWIDLSQQLSLGEIKHLISHAKLFVGMDSGPYHIACTTDTPILLLSSHLAPEQILPWRDGEFGKNCAVVKSDVPCLGCYARHTPPVRVLTCENEKEWACAKAFDNAQMFEAAVKILDDNND
jgi:ADP-heptose:LPS heptosyltransferase